MTHAEMCPRCGGRIRLREGLCPACVLDAALGFADQVTDDDSSAEESGADLPAGEKSAGEKSVGDDTRSAWLDAAQNLTGDLDRPHGNASASTKQAFRNRSVTVPGYDILEELGHGGMGVVYKARHQKLDHVVALKMIRAGAHASQHDRHRFVTEAQAVARLKHPNIVQIHELGEHEGVPYFTLEYCEGGSLALWLKERGDAPVPADQAASLIECLARAIDFAHQRNIVHRDLTPGNILFQISDHGLQEDKTEQSAVQEQDTRSIPFQSTLSDFQTAIPKVSDFGLAKQLDVGEGHTRSGAVMGTPSYMSPEQAASKGSQIGPRTDVYALGAILYKLLTGLAPFRGSTPVDTIMQVIRDEPAPPSRLQPRTPRDLETICLKCLHKDPAARYGSAGALADDLRRFVNDEPILARASGRFEKSWRWCRRNPMVASLLAGIVFVFLAGFAGVFSQWREAEKARFKANQQRDDADEARIAAQSAQQKQLEIAEQAKADREIAQREAYLARIQLAEAMLKGDLHSKYRVADILWEARPELRGWEWGYLMAGCPLEQWSLDTNQGGLDVLTASPDGRYLATAGTDGTVALWDSWTRAELWRRKTGRSISLAIDAHNRYVGVGSADDSQPYFRVLDLATGRLKHEANATGRAQVVFNSSGRDLYVRRMYRFERFSSDSWHRLSSTPLFGWHIWTMLIPDLAGEFIAIHNYGHLARGERPFHMTLFDAQSLQTSAELQAILPRGYSNLTSDSNPVLHSGLGKIVYSYGSMVFADTLQSRSSNSSEDRVILDLPGMVRHLAWDPRTETIIAATENGTIVHIDSSGKKQESWHGSPICGLVLLADGQFVTGGADGLLKCWERNPGTEVANNFSVKTSSASASGPLTFAGKRLLYQNWRREKYYLLELSPPLGHVFSRPEPGGYGLRFPVIRPQTNEFVVDGAAGLSFYSLEREGPKAEKNRFIAIANPFSAAFDASGQLLVVSNSDEKILVMNLSSEERLPSPDVSELGMVAINPAGSLAALQTATGIHIWEVSTGRQLPFVEYRPEAGPGRVFGEIAFAPVFHPNGELIAFFEELKGSMSLILWDTTRGQRRTSIQGKPGVGFVNGPDCCVFSADGKRILIPCNDAKVRIWDWHLGKELLALSDLTSASNVAVNSDGLTIAYSGWAPSLRVAKALPFDTRRDAAFYRALDDFRIFSEQLNVKKDTAKFDELAGDIHLRRGEASKAKELYARAIALRQHSVLQAPDDVEQQQMLAALFEKCLAAAETVASHGGIDVLQEAVAFWQQIPFDSPARQYLLLAQLRLVDRRLVAGHNTNGQNAAINTLEPMIKSWAERFDKDRQNRFVRSGLRELLARYVWVSRLQVQSPALERLLSNRPVLAVLIGDLHAGDNQWKAALTWYRKGITAEKENAELICKMARTHEGQKNWDAALADWSRTAILDPKTTMELAEFAQRLAANGQNELANTARTRARKLFEEQLAKDPTDPEAAAGLANLLQDFIAPDASRLSDGLIGHWTFDGTPSASQSPSGKLVGDVVFRKSPFGQAISLDGTSGFVRFSPKDATDVGTSEFTVAAWIRPRDTRQAGIVARGNYDLRHGWLLDVVSDGVLRLETSRPGNGPNGTIQSSTLVIHPNEWQHVAAVVRRGENQARLIVNGYQVALGTVPAVNLDNPELGLHIGRIPESVLFCGEIDEVRLYRRALRAAEIKALVEPGKHLTRRPHSNFAHPYASTDLQNGK